MSEFIIDITRNLEDFKHKLESEPRVVLSAGFGDGKTFFLKRFQEKYTEEYHFFTIYPAQYVIGTNEAIFEYIKRDILFQIVDKGIVTEEFDLAGMLKEMAEYVDVSELTSFFVSKPIAALLGTVVKQVKGIMNLVNRHRISGPFYIDSFLSAKGGLYENDAYTCMIRKCFEKMKEHDGRQIVLIIEDLDRIDPSHIFSILNIFGSHFDRHFVVNSHEQENKFGVDRLITVMDYDKLEVLYNHQYGEEGESNFNGYISKYICSKPFRYSIRAEARKQVTEKIYALYSFTNQSDIGMKQRLSQALGAMNIRDLERVFMFDPAKALRNPDGTIDINGHKLSPKSPIVFAQAYRMFFDLSCLPERTTPKQPDDLSEVEAVGPLVIMGKWLDYYGIPKWVLYNEHTYSATPVYDDENRLLTIRFKRARSYAIPFIKIDDTEHLYNVESLFEPYFYFETDPDDYELEDDYPGEDDEESA